MIFFSKTVTIFETTIIYESSANTFKFCSNDCFAEPIICEASHHTLLAF